MTTIKWQVGWAGTPVPVEVVSETDCFVTVREVRHTPGGERSRDRKIKKAGAIFDTFADAKAALVADAENRLADIEKMLLMANERLTRANNLRSPE